MGTVSNISFGLFRLELIVESKGAIGNGPREDPVPFLLWRDWPVALVHDLADEGPHSSTHGYTTDLGCHYIHVRHTANKRY